MFYFIIFQMMEIVLKLCLPMKELIRLDVLNVNECENGSNFCSSLYLCIPGLHKLGTRCRSGALGHTKPLSHQFFGGAYFALLKSKIIRTTNLQLNRSNNEKVIVNSKYYREHQRTCDILMFMSVMAS